MRNGEKIIKFACLININIPPEPDLMDTLKDNVYLATV